MRSTAIAAMGALLLVLASMPARAQVPQTRIDSLQRVLARTTADTSKVGLLCDLSDAIGPQDNAQAMAYSEEALDLARRMNWPVGMAYALETVGRCHWRNGAFAKARECHTQSLALWRSLHRADRVALNLTYLGQDHADAGEYPVALAYLDSALNAYHEASDQGNDGMLHGVIAWVYGSMGMFPEAVKHQYASLRAFDESGDRYGLAVTTMNLAGDLVRDKRYEEAIGKYKDAMVVLEEVNDHVNGALSRMEIGQCYRTMGRYADAMKQYAEVLERAQAMKDGDMVGLVHRRMAETEQAQGRLAEALEEALRSRDAYTQANRNAGLFAVQILITDLLMQLNRLPAAKAALDQAQNLSRELPSLGDRSSYFGAAAQLDSATGNWRGAFEHYKRFIASRDSMFNEENTKQMERSRMQYVFEKKEAESRAEQEKKDAIAQQEMRRQRVIRNGFIGGFALVAVFAGIFLGQRNRISKARKRSDELLLNILPEEVAEELKDTGAAQAKHFDTATILFTDFKGFTQLSEKVTPAELVAELNICFKEFDALMTRYRIEKIKTIGDAYMAAGGLPDPQHGSPADVILAALEMQEFMKRHKAERDAQGKPYFEMRVGIHTGPVVAGIVGVKKFQYDIWGDTVNTASRMESSGEVGQVNISQATYALVKDDASLIFTPRGKVQAKGKGEMEMYFVRTT